MWMHVDIAGKPAEVFDPPAPPRFGLIHLHGVGEETYADKPVFTRLLGELGLGCVCPRGRRSWWADRICPEFDPAVTAERYVVESVRPFVIARWGLADRRIGLTGIGMGGQGALRIAFKHPETFPVVAAIAAAVDYHDWYGQGTPLDDMYDSKEQCRQDTVLMHIDPTRQPPHIFFCVDPDDPWHRGNDRLHEKLSALGVAHECDLTTRAGGHTWEYYNHNFGRVLRFVVAGLEQESRRLL
jgi:esterase/lipase superfamily enzyme